MGSMHPHLPSPPPPPPEREKTAPQPLASQALAQPAPATPGTRGQPTSLLELGAIGGAGGGAPASPGARGNRKRVRRIEQPGPFAWTEGRDTKTPDGLLNGRAPTPRPLSPLEQGLEAYRKSRQDMLDRSGGQHPAPGPLGTVPQRPDPSQNLPLGRMPAGGALTPLGRMPQGDKDGTGGPMSGIQRVSLTDPGQGALGTPNRPNAPQGTQVAVAPAIVPAAVLAGGALAAAIAAELARRNLEADGLEYMEPAEPLEPLPPFPTDDGLNTTQFPGQDPDRARQDAIPEPESYPESDWIIPADTGHDGGIDGLPDMTIVEIRPRTEADLNKPAVEVLGKGDRWLIPDFEKWLNSDERKALEAYRKERQSTKEGPRDGTPPYGPIWDALKNPHRHKNHPSRQFRFDWDYKHGGEIEVRNKNGTSVGVLNPITGVWEKPKPRHPFHGKR